MIFKQTPLNTIITACTFVLLTSMGCNRATDPSSCDRVDTVDELKDYLIEGTWDRMIDASAELRIDIDPGTEFQIKKGPTFYKNGSYYVTEDPSSGEIYLFLGFENLDNNANTDDTSWLKLKLDNNPCKGGGFDILYFYVEQKHANIPYFTLGQSMSFSRNTLDSGI